MNLRERLELFENPSVENSEAHLYRVTIRVFVTANRKRPKTKKTVYHICSRDGLEKKIEEVYRNFYETAPGYKAVILSKEIG